MTNSNIYLEIFSEENDDNDGGGGGGCSMIKVPLETYIALNLFKYLQQEKNSLIVNLVKTNPGNKIKKYPIWINVTKIPYRQITSENYELEIANLCNFPVLVTEENVVIAGLCGVCRGMIKCSKRTDRMNLLGFKSACLLAPAETSIWTRFCEIDIIKCTEQILNDSLIIPIHQNNDKYFEFPDEIGQFECHMGQPVRAHNIYKIARNMAKETLISSGDENKKTTDNLLTKKMNEICLNEENTEILAKKKEPRTNKTKKGYQKPIKISSSVPMDSLNLEHKFVEGAEFTLADIILYSCFMLIFKKLPINESLQTNLPLTIKWMNNMSKALDDNLSELFITSDEDNLNKSTTTTILQYKVKKIENYSLYKNDSKRYKPQSKIFTKQSDVQKSLDKISKIGFTISSSPSSTLSTNNDQQTFDWNSIPYDALPEGGNLPIDRLERKKHQLQSLAQEILNIAKTGDRIVDFCSGAGHLGIIIAYKLPKCQIILLENKEESLMRAKRRVEQLKLKNVLFFQCNLDYFHGKFNIGTSLHACGVATDIVLWHCQRQRANFVCCPCCYGGIHQMPHISYPRSNFFNNVAKITNQDFMHLAHCADQAHDPDKGKCNMEKSLQGQLCMDCVDWDRKLCAEEQGYRVQLTRLQPENCTPKNRLLIGLIDNVAVIT